MSCLGFDTSNYTTSVAVSDGTAGVNCSRLLDVKPGHLGLRQSDALFSHVKRLPELMEQLFDRWHGVIGAVCASTQPRAVEGSYMPCFLAGESQARSLAAALGVPFYAVSHQQGHLMACLWSAGRMELAERPFLAWHLSGGTTELLYVAPEPERLTATIIGGTEDLSAGQLIDRTGLLLNAQFPCGKTLDCLSSGVQSKGARVKCENARFHLSGAENQVQKLHSGGASDGETAAFALATVCNAVCAATEQALARYPGLPVVFSGGVASNSMLRARCRDFDAVFATPEFSTDNAMGVALLGALQGGI